MLDLTSPTAVLALWAVVAYLIGSVPSGILVARAMGLGDVRQIGSGNIGATNVLRTGSKKAAAATLAFDMFKGLIAVLAAGFFAAPDAASLAGLFVMLGHCFPVWLRFRGGKGIATFFGVLFGLAWPVGVVAALAWIATAYLLRYSSLAGLVAALIVPVAALFIAPSIVLLTLLLTALIFLRHAENIRRLAAGTETKIGAK